jgi:hypothetical protein
LFCRGDGDGDRIVAIDELIGGVAAALGGPAAPAFDADRNGRITIAELIAGVGNANEGCTR